MGLAKRIGKIAVLVGVCDGFIGNRMVAAYGAEARRLLIEEARRPRRSTRRSPIGGSPWVPSP